MSRIIRICFNLLALVATTAGAATNVVMQAEYRFPTITLDTTPVDSLTTLERFESSFQQNTERIFTDRFHPLLTMQWNLNAASLSVAEFRSQPTDAARKALTRSVATSARAAVIDLPIVMWLEGRKGFFVDLLKNSVEASTEAAVDPLDPSYRAVDKAWWQRLADSKSLNYGLRPFRTSPYAFVSASIRNGDALLLMTHVRYHYSNFAEHQFELAVSMPLSPGLALELGTAYKISAHSETSAVVLKLAKQIGRNGIVHVGMEAQEHPRLIAGISMPL